MSIALACNSAACPSALGAASPCFPLCTHVRLASSYAFVFEVLGCSSNRCGTRDRVLFHGWRFLLTFTDGLARQALRLSLLSLLRCPSSPHSLSSLFLRRGIRLRTITSTHLRMLTEK